jgi:hypothetical protein
MFTRISSVLVAALIFVSASAASAATVHKPVKHYYHHPVIMLLENNPAFLSYSQNEANTETAIRFQEQFDNSY